LGPRAVGPASYDLSTFLLRFDASERPWILDLYRESAAESGWQLPADEDLNVLFETAECARCASCLIWPAIALVEERAAWAFDKLPVIEEWFEAMQPVFAGERETQTRRRPCQKYLIVNAMISARARDQPRHHRGPPQRHRHEHQPDW